MTSPRSLAPAPAPAPSAPVPGPAAPVRPPRRRSRAGAVAWAAVAVLAVAAGALALRMMRAMARPVPRPDVGTVKPTANGRYRVLLAAERAPVPLNRLHRWTVRVEPAAGRAGTPAAPAVVTVDGGMPRHGHGLPTAPRVTGRLPDGRLVIDGVKFSMPGWWELRLRVAGAGGTDSVTFNLVL